jgi:hypothetical protein
MGKHFIFEPGSWIGEGKVSFSTTLESLHFYTKWIVKEKVKDRLVLEQLVEMQGVHEKVINQFTLKNITESGFDILLENDLIGSCEGKGMIQGDTVGWEFRGESGLEGFETFQKQENGEYQVKAEYASPDQFRSMIHGRIWKQER